MNTAEATTVSWPCSLTSVLTRTLCWPWCSSVGSGTAALSCRTALLPPSMDASIFSVKAVTGAPALNSTTSNMQVCVAQDGIVHEGGWGRGRRGVGGWGMLFITTCQPDVMMLLQQKEAPGRAEKMQLRRSVQPKSSNRPTTHAVNWLLPNAVFPSPTSPRYTMLLSSTLLCCEWGVCWAVLLLASCADDGGAAASSCRATAGSCGASCRVREKLSLSALLLGPCCCCCMVGGCCWLLITCVGWMRPSNTPRPDPRHPVEASATPVWC